MTDIPPPRYRIVERGRRLEVIDTHAARGAAPPPPRSMLAGRPPPRTALPPPREPATKLVLGWTALVVAAVVAVAAYAAMGFPAVVALAALVIGLYQKHKGRIDAWIASLD